MNSSYKTIIDNKNIFKIGKSPLKANSSIEVHGFNNTVEIGDNVKGTILINIIGNDSKVLIEDDVNIMGSLNIVARRGKSTVVIGKGSSFMGLVRLFNHEPSSIKIGADCMFAGDILMTTSDMHPIYDADNIRINPPSPIAIGEHVWVGVGVKLLKGVSIGSGSIVGMASLVTKGTYPEKCIIVGSPAKIVKENVRWDRNFPPLP